jgi:predicted amidophosphoribosyltransferase
LHFYLSPDDYCLYIGDYTSHRNYTFGPFNQLIKNIKTPPSRRISNPPEYRYKEIAISQVAQCFRNILELRHLENDLTLVPIPPSKAITNPEYDDRMLRVCQQMVQGLTSPDVKPLIETIDDMGATHLDGHKPPPEVLKTNYRIICEEDYHPRRHILLLDDVLTTGSHFKACQSLLQERFPGVSVHGLFISRRVFPDDE